MTRAKPSRVNARLPPDVARKVSYLEKHTNQSTTQVLRESIEHYYATVTEGTGKAAEALERAGFIGCANGPADLSSSYKAELARSTIDKT